MHDRITLLGDDNGRTELTLDLDPAKARQIDPNTIEVTPPPGWENDTPTPIDAQLVLMWWYNDLFADLAHMGVTVVEFREDGEVRHHPRATATAR